MCGFQFMQMSITDDRGTIKNRFDLIAATGATAAA